MYLVLKSLNMLVTNTILSLLNPSLFRRTPPEGGARLPLCERQAQRAPMEEGFSERFTCSLRLSTQPTKLIYRPSLSFFAAIAKTGLPITLY
jgi:hypothetical protein